MVAVLLDNSNLISNRWVHPGIELKRQIADAGHEPIVVVDDNAYVC